MRQATPTSSGMRHRKIDPPPIIDPKAARPFWGDAAPFTLEEGQELWDQLNRLTPDAAKAYVMFEKIRAAMQRCQAQLQLQVIPRRSTSDVSKPLRAAAETGKFNPKKQWLCDALIFGAQKAGISVGAVNEGNCAAVKVAAKTALAARIGHEKPGRPANTAQDEYTAHLRDIYKQLTGRKPTITRATDATKTAEKHKVTGKAPDFFRAAMAPLGASDDQVAEAILDRK